MTDSSGVLTLVSGKKYFNNIKFGTAITSNNPWSISMWVKPSTSTNTQTLFYYGGDDLANEGRIEISQFSGNNVLFRYGSTNDNIVMIGVSNFIANQWNHILVTYDGGLTGNASGNIADYILAFSMTVNGSTSGISPTHANFGYTGSIAPDNFRIGKLDGATTSSPLLDGIVNQVAIWNTDESSNLATIYNSGAPQDLSLLSSAPTHLYEVEASVTSILDLTGSADLTGYNFAISDLVSDVPS